MVKKYKCEECNYITVNSGNWYKHVKSKKHQKNIGNDVDKQDYTRVKMENKILTTFFKDLIDDTQNESQGFQCEFCKKIYTRKDALKRHQKTCVKKNKEIQPEILKLFDDFKDSITKDINTNKNNIMTDIPPITQEALRTHLEKFTLDYIQEGAKGYAEYANIYALKDYIICTDKSRKKIKFKKEDGSIVNDLGGTKISKLFFNSIKDKNKQLIDAEYNLLKNEVQRIGSGGKAGRNDLTNTLERSTMLQNLLYQCNDAALGKTNKLTQAFVRHLTKEL